MRRRSLLALLVLAVAPAALAGPASAQEPAPPVPPAEAPLVIAVRDIRPFAYPTDKGWKGYSIEMWEDAAAELEVDYTYVEVPTVADQIDSVASGRTQAALGAISITAERSEVVDFTQPMYDSGLQILVRSGDDDGGLFGVLAGLFSRTFLFLLVGLGILLVIVGHIIWLVERRRNDDHFPRGYFAGVWEGIWWAMVTMATVGYGDRVARTRAGRVVSMLWMLAGLVLVAQFTALVTATLTVDRIQSDVSAIGDLYGREVGTVAATSAARYLQDIDLQATGYADIDEATDALLDGTVEAVVYDSPVLKYFALTGGKDRTQVVGPLYQPQGYGMAFQQGSALVEEVDQEFLVLREDGTAAALRDRFFG